MEVELNVLVNLYNKGLGEVPTHAIEEVFEHAVRECKSFPKPAHLIAIWDKIKMTVPEEQYEVKERPRYLTSEERTQMLQVLENYPQFADLIRELGIEDDSNGYISQEWWNRFNELFEISFPNTFVL